VAESNPVLAALAWLEPWAPVPSDRAAALEKALGRELCEGHALYGRQVRAIAVRSDCDDVLFELLDAPGFVVVHLTPHKSQAPDLPMWMRFDSIAAFREGCMEPDHLEHVDDDV
jgi:hypothetical protein